LSTSAGVERNDNLLIIITKRILDGCIASTFYALPNEEMKKQKKCLPRLAEAGLPGSGQQVA